MSINQRLKKTRQLKFRMVSDFRARCKTCYKKKHRLSKGGISDGAIFGMFFNYSP